jgi:hypothetical protein
MEILKLNNPIVISTGGGSLSQLSSLMLAIFVQKKYDRDYVLEYFNDGMEHTNGFVFSGVIDSSLWREITLHNSICNKSQGEMTWSRIPQELKPILEPIRYLYGQTIQSFKYVKRELSNRRGVNLVTRYADDFETFKRIRHRTRSISGNFGFMLFPKVESELREVLIKHEALFAISKEKIQRKSGIAIHYRLGDMRKDATYRNTHGVVDPRDIGEIIQQINESTKVENEIFLFSDEFDIAANLLLSIGVKVKNFQRNESIWQDLSNMCGYEYLVGSYSSVTLMAAEIRKLFFCSPTWVPLNSREHRLKFLQTPPVHYWNAHTLPLEHEIYRI